MGVRYSSERGIRGCVIWKEVAGDVIWRREEERWLSGVLFGCK